MLNYDYKAGSKGTLVFIHGAGGSRRKWRSLMSDLPEGYGGLALDLPGHGESTGEAQSDVSEYARVVRDSVTAIGPTRPLIWVGHSLGGAIVLMVALIDPNAVDYLVLVGTGARLRVVPAFLENLRQGIVNPAFKRRAFSPATDEALINAEIEMDLTVDPVVVYRDFLACDNFDVMSRLPEIQQPTQVIVGADDLLTPPKYSEYLVKNLPNSTLAVIPAAGHMVMLEQPAAVKQVITEFLRQHNH